MHCGPRRICSCELQVGGPLDKPAGPGWEAKTHRRGLLGLKSKLRIPVSYGRTTWALQTLDQTGLQAFRRSLRTALHNVDVPEPRCGASWAIDPLHSIHPKSISRYFPRGGGYEG